MSWEENKISFGSNNLGTKDMFEERSVYTEDIWPKDDPIACFWEALRVRQESMSAAHRKNNWEQLSHLLILWPRPMRISE